MSWRPADHWLPIINSWWVIPVWNTLGVIPGYITDEVVVVGNHRNGRVGTSSIFRVMSCSSLTDSISSSQVGKVKSTCVVTTFNLSRSCQLPPLEMGNLLGTCRNQTSKSILLGCRWRSVHLFASSNAGISDCPLTVDYPHRDAGVISECNGNSQSSSGFLPMMAFLCSSHLH